MSDEYLTAAIYGMKRFNEGVKRIINMEKLDELLKDFQLEKGDWVRIDGPEVEMSEKEKLALEATLISYKYGFIKRLLTNQKIDQEKLDHSLDSCSYIKNDLAGSCIKLTMFLAIQDEPIEFLVSILK